MNNEKIVRVVLHCRGCKRESTFWPDRALDGPEELVYWIVVYMPRCRCGYPFSDVHAFTKEGAPA
jgi:hypothetical protein